MDIDELISRLGKISVRPFFIFISGGSCSGKTFLAKKLMLLLKNDATLIEMDDYFKDREDETLPMFGGKLSFDLPDSYHLDEIRQGLIELKESKQISVPIYDIGSNKRIGRKVVEQKEIIIVDGLYASKVSDAIVDVNQKINVLILTSTHIRIQRRIKRDRERFGCSSEEIINSFLKFVEPVDKLYVSKQKADIIIQNNYRKGD